MRTLATRQVTTTESLRVHTHAGAGHRVVMWDTRGVCDDGEATYARSAKLAIEAGSLHDKAVAWIGGGFCIGPRVFAASNCRQTVYEIEAALAEFCPDGIKFVPGDWHDTLSGTFDVIVFDLGGEIDYAKLAQHLRPGGVILPKDEN